jgi:hypothetical protein
MPGFSSSPITYWTRATSSCAGESGQILSELMTASQEGYVSPVNLAMISVGLNDTEVALNWLEQAYNRRDPALCDILRQLRFRSLYTHSRFKTLLQRMGLPATQ